MMHLGLTGFPLEHSLSPGMHTAALASFGIEGDYSLFPVHRDNLRGLEDLVARVRSGELQGLNVTIPHKQAIVPLLDELTRAATAIGAVNTIYMKESKLVGHNTDAQGFQEDLKHIAGVSAFRDPPCALILGAGGAARAIVSSLTSGGWNITVAARRASQAHELAEDFRSVKVTDFNAPEICTSDVQMIVNATPCGMFPHVDQSPWPDGLPFPPAAVVYDLVYCPRETKLVRDARAQGLRATAGLGMLVEQAALAFEAWTGRRPRREILLSATENKCLYDS